MMPTIAEECSEFITESKGRCLVKNLPTSYQGFSRVKVRFKKQTTNFIESFNEAFKNRRRDLHQRAIFTYSDKALLTEEEGSEPFYVFPINGYKVIFNPLVKNSYNAYRKYEQLSIDDELITDQLKMTYSGGSLDKALNSECEIVLYGIPYYYAIRSSLIEDYNSFFNNTET